MLIKRAQFVALFFSLGLGLALLLMIATQDIAFAWSTTLQVSPQGFHSVLVCVSSPWSFYFPSAVPSLELIEQSHYFRLGDNLSQKMINDASSLGAWWKFLLCATIFYAIFLRFCLYLLSVLGFQLAITKSILSMEGVKQILEDMNEPIISTHAIESMDSYEVVHTGELQIIDAFRDSYNGVQGWAMPVEKLLVLNDILSINSQVLYEVGGTNSLKVDSEIIAKSQGEILLYVKGWEPPTMDFIDYLEELLIEVDRVTVMPIGTEENSYIPMPKSIEVWSRKLALLEHNKVYFKHFTQGSDI
ncbi:MAG: DUF2868 domain-containing protein [Sulfurovum sp.]|nr:DUF2868 domain-containing protein [Sulfurovum sp.]